MLTFDVVVLYTGISHEFGLEAIDYFLTKYQEDLHPIFKKEFVSELVNCILKKHALAFDAEFYLQIKVTAMGAIFAPTYTNLIIGYHEIKFYSIIRLSYGLASKSIENSWFRYSDNCQILMKVNLIKPEHLLRILKRINNIIQFTMEKVRKDCKKALLKQKYPKLLKKS